MTVYLVGAGPGDPELLTVRAARVLGQADFVVHDRLVGTGVLELVPPTAERIDVGKRPGAHRATQPEINQLLIDLAGKGETVVRLKGGDPFVLGRGGEEAAALGHAGIPYEVVPGISSAIAAPMAAGIPVTLRGVAHSFTVVTGHEDPATGSVVDWEALARTRATLVILMGASRIATIAARLLGGGLAADTPVACVYQATLPEQSVLRTTLGAVGREKLMTPTTIIVGRAAAEALQWVGSEPAR